MYTPETPDLDTDLILEQVCLKARTHIRTVQLFARLPSTHDYVLDAIKRGAGSGLLCLAQHQTMGHGSHGRPWHSLPGSALCLSLSWRIPDHQPTAIRVAQGLIQALEAYGITQGLHIKAPNDVLYQHKKLAGILIETTNQSHAWVISIGLNFTVPEALRAQIDQPCTDIQSITQQPPNRNLLTGLVVGHVIGHLC